jgi:hypothetical protein
MVAPFTYVAYAARVMSPSSTGSASQRALLLSMPEQVGLAQQVRQQLGLRRGYARPRRFVHSKTPERQRLALFRSSCLRPTRARS